MNHCPLHDCKGQMAAEVSSKEGKQSARDFSEDTKAIAELQALSPEAKEFLNHHIRNAMTGVVNYYNLERYEEATQAALQLVDVLETIAPAPELKTIWPDAHGL